MSVRKSDTYLSVHRNKAVILGQADNIKILVDLSRVEVGVTLVFWCWAERHADLHVTVVIESTIASPQRPVKVNFGARFV